MDMAAIIALLAQLPGLLTQLIALYQNVVANLSEDDRAKLEAELMRLRGEMPDDIARVHEALDRAIAAGNAPTTPSTLVGAG